MLVLRIAPWLVLATLIMQRPVEAAVPPEEPVRVLTNLQQVIHLTRAEALVSQYDARVEGVIIYVSLPTRRLYLQVGEDGLQVDLNGPANPYHVGQFVEVSGTVLAVEPRNRIIRASARVLGEQPLPTPKPVTARALASGQDFMRLVTVRGVVRDMTTDRATLTLLATSEELTFPILFPTRSIPPPRELLDAEIEVTGISYPIFSAAGRPDSFRFHVQTTNSIRVIKPGATSLFDRPTLKIAEASRQPRDWHSRIKISGTVIYHRDEALYIDDGTGVMQVSLLTLLARSADGRGLDHEPQSQLEPGEKVEVIGARENLFFLAPMLMHAEFRRAGQGTPVQPLPVRFEDLRDGRQAGRLVSIEARLLDHRGWTVHNTPRHLFVFQAGENIFQANWVGDKPVPWDFQPDTYVRVTGINEAQGGEFNTQPTFELRIRSPADIVHSANPPFWSRPETRKTLVTGLAISSIALILILLQRLHLRRLEAQVARRTSDLSNTNLRLQQEVGARERAEEDLRVALAAEKELNQLKSSFVSMVSHEFRTPLEVILSSSHILDRYLDRLPPERRREQLRAIRKSVHRMSDLMEDILMLGKFEAARVTFTPVPIDLAEFCQRCIDEIESATESICPIRFEAIEISDEATADESLLGPVVTNLLSNAVKYSPPGSPVELRVARHGTDAEIIVRDRGCGIPAADQPRLFTAFHRASNVGNITGSGLGLVIVQRCVQLHGGMIRCESVEGQGTKFTVTMPVFDSPRLPHSTAVAVIDSTTNVPTKNQTTAAPQSTTETATAVTAPD